MIRATSIPSNSPNSYAFLISVFFLLSMPSAFRFFLILSLFRLICGVSIGKIALGHLIALESEDWKPDWGSLYDVEPSVSKLWHGTGESKPVGSKWWDSIYVQIFMPRPFMGFAARRVSCLESECALYERDNDRVEILKRKGYVWKSELLMVWKSKSVWTSVSWEY